MTAVIRPVGVDHAHLGDGGVAVLVVLIVRLQELQVIQIHCQTHVLQHIGQRSLVHRDEALNHSDLARDLVDHLEGLGLVCCSLAGVNRVDEVAADLVHVVCGQLALEHIDLGADNGRTLAACQQLDALCAGVRALVVLTGQRLDRQNGVLALRGREGLIVAYISHRLREHDALCLLVRCGLESLNVITAQITHAGQPLDLEQPMQAVEQALCLDIKAGALFGKTTENCHFDLLLFCVGFICGFYFFSEIQFPFILAFSKFESKR